MSTRQPMNREAVIKQIKELAAKMDLSLNDIWLGAGAAMVLHGLRQETDDLDIGCCSYMLYRTANHCQKSVEYITKEMGYIENGRVLNLDEEYRATLHEENYTGNKMLTRIQGILCYNLPALLAQKKKMNREKDQPDITLLELALLQ